MAKILVTAHLGRHFRIFGHYDYKVLLNMGHEVHIAANFSDKIDNFKDLRVVKHQVDFDRNPFSIQNIKAFKQLKKLFEREKFDLIHTQSPSGGAITRLAAKDTRKKGTKVIYTAHGFHFFEGANHKNWLLYYNIEKKLAKMTDCILTINEEDFSNSEKFFPSVKTHLINGVGIDLKKFSKENILKSNVRQEFNINEDDFLLIFVGELSVRKNQITLIRAMKYIIKEVPNAKLLLVGAGDREETFIKEIEENNLRNKVILTGYRSDILELLSTSDMLVSASKQEGLPLNVMEGMAMGLPLVLSNCRGNRDLLQGNGFLINTDSPIEFSRRVSEIYKDRDMYKKMSETSIQIVQKYSLEIVEKQMVDIYRSLI